MATGSILLEDKKAKIRRLLTIQNQGSHLRDFDP